MSIHNYMEDIVAETLEILFSERNDLCKCDKCKLDIINSYIRNLDFIYDCMYKVLTSNESKLQDLEILGKMYMVMYHQIDPFQV